MAGGKPISFESWCGSADWEPIRDRALIAYALYCLDLFPYMGYANIPESDELTRKLVRLLHKIEG